MAYRVWSSNIYMYSGFSYTNIQLRVSVSEVPRNVCKASFLFNHVPRNESWSTTLLAYMRICTLQGHTIYTIHIQLSSESLSVSQSYLRYIASVYWSLHQCRPPSVHVLLSLLIHTHASSPKIVVNTSQAMSWRPFKVYFAASSACPTTFFNSR